MSVFRKTIVLLLSLVFIASTFCISGNAVEPTEPIFTYDNSIVAMVTVDTERSFVPDDFPEIDCNAVYVVSKLKTDTWYDYELVLTLDGNVNNALSAVCANSMVSLAKRNSYALEASVVELSKSELVLPIGKSAELEIAKFIDVVARNIVGVAFEIDSEVIADDSIQSGCFDDYGIKNFWSAANSRIDDSFECLKDSNNSFSWADEGQVSTNGLYFGIFNNELGDVYNIVDVIECVNKLASLRGINSVVLCDDTFPSGNPWEEVWKISDSNVASISLSGGTSADINQGIATDIGQTATVTGLSAGSTTLSFERSGFGAYGCAICSIIVVSPADVNGDGVADNTDAAVILRYDAGAIDLTDVQLKAGDVNGDGEVDNLDAAKILQYDAGIIDSL